MTTHISADGHRTPSPRGHWLKLSAALTEAVADLADRDDLTVSCAPGNGRGAPGCFLPALASIELDGDHLGVAPGTCDPLRSGDINRYPALWGVLTHEAAHAHHTRWTPPKGAGGRQVEAAMLLEESRIEAGQLRRRPADRRWLRSSAQQIVMDGFTAGPRPDDPWVAAHAAGLLLGRRDAGVFDYAETVDVSGYAVKVLGRGTLDDLRAIWLAAHATADDDAAGMLELGRRWCEVLGIDPQAPATQPDTSSAPGVGQGGGHGSGQNGDGQDGDGDAPRSPVEEAVAKAVEKVTVNERNEHAAEREAAEKAAKAIEAAKRARRDADKVFRRDKDGVPAPGGTSGSTALAGTRPATAAEQGAARRLAKLLRNAAQRERTATVTSSATPPGRLRMRGALAADAQRAAGRMPTAEPFLRTERRHVPNPPLRVGIACDVSGSMRPLAGPVASAAYILGRAASHVPDATAATVIYGRYVRAVTYPGTAPTQVAEFRASDSAHQIGGAVRALDVALGLDRPGAARLLVIVSDGHYDAAEARAGQAEITRLVRSGCAVLWLALGAAVPMRGTQLVSLKDPAQAAGVIGQAAVRALRSA